MNGECPYCRGSGEIAEEFDFGNMQILSCPVCCGEGREGPEPQQTDKLDEVIE